MPEVTEHLFIKPTVGASQRVEAAITSCGVRRSVSTVVKSARWRPGHTLPAASVTEAPRVSMAFPVKRSRALPAACFSAAAYRSRSVSTAFWLRSVPAPI